MLTGMQMDTFDDGAVVTAFEACAGFTDPGDDSPTCAGCGWLEAEHDHATAEVRPLAGARRRPATRLPRRLAS